MSDRIPADNSIPGNGWICGTGLDEPAHAHFTDTYESREAAITAAPSELGLPKGEFFQTGLLRYTKDFPPNPFDVEHEFDRFDHSEWDPDTVTEPFVDACMPHVAELQAQLDKVWSDWIAKHDLAPTVFYIDDVESHTVGEDADEPDDA